MNDFPNAVSTLLYNYKIHHVTVPLLLDCEDIFVGLYGDKQHSFWLDSSLVVPRLSRWSFMGTPSATEDYFCRFNLEHQLIETCHPAQNKTNSIHKSIFDYLEQQFDYYSITPPADLNELPFMGGYVGYFGYELKKLTCDAPSFKSPYPDAAFLFSTRFLAVDHQRNNVHIIALYHNDQTQEQALDWANETVEKISLLSKAPAVSPLSHPSVKFDLRHHRQAYLNHIQTCLDQIAAGESYELCLTNEITAQARINPLDLYRLLRRRNPAPYAAFLRFDDLAVACSSPERFLRIDGAGNAETKPIKGTARRDPNPDMDEKIAHDLRCDEKSRSENLMIVDLMRNDLGKICKTGSVHVPSLMHIESYQTVHQLVSTIRGSLRPDENAIRCIKACFPGGSMTGAPKIRTLEILDKMEKGPRGIYSGSIGYLSLNKEVDLNIVIRTIVYKDEQLSIGCGGAIVALSDPIEEFNEILLKANMPLQVISQLVTGKTDLPLDIGGAEDHSANGQVMLASPQDAAELALCAYNLLRELGGPGPQFTIDKAQKAALHMINSPDLGAVLLVKDPDTQKIAGFAAISAVHAMRAGGDYGVLQELWVHPDHRGRHYGAALLRALDDLGQQRGWPMIELTMPTDDYPHWAQLTDYYLSMGYQQTGTRLRKRLN